MSQDTSLICLAALVSEQIEELLGRLAVPAGVRPHQPAGVMVDHDREVSLPLRTAISSIPIRVRPASRSRWACASAATRWQIQPTDRQAIRISSETAVLLRVDRQPRDLVLEAAGEPGVVARPRDRGDDHPVAMAAHARRPRLQKTERGPEIQRPPPPTPFALVITRAPPPAVRAAITLPRPRSDRHDHRPVVRRTARPRPPPGAVRAAASIPSIGARRPSFDGVPDLRSRNPRSAAACAPSSPPVGRSCARHRCPKARPAAAVKQHRNAANRGPVSRISPRNQALLDRRRPAALPRAHAHLTHGTCRSALKTPPRPSQRPTRATGHQRPRQRRAPATNPRGFARRPPRKGRKISATGGLQLPQSCLCTSDRIGETCDMKPVIATA